jgi:hypothetical protein
MGTGGDARRALISTRTAAEARFEAGVGASGRCSRRWLRGAAGRAAAGLPAEAHALAAITALTVMLWVTEAIPLAAAALLAPALAVLLGVTMRAAPRSRRWRAR